PGDRSVLHQCDRARQASFPDPLERARCDAENHQGPRAARDRASWLSVPCCRSSAGVFESPSWVIVWRLRGGWPHTTDRHADETITDGQQLDQETGNAIRAFWEREQANVSGEEATRRLDEVVAHVVDERGELVAVATVAQKILPRLGQPMYYYRCFVGKAWRSSKLVRPLLRHTYKVLEKYARANNFPCIGVLLELENEGFTDSLRWAQWPSVDFSYI